MPDILPITTSASPDNIMQISARTNANLITLPGILDIASLFQMCKEESERAHTHSREGRKRESEWCGRGQGRCEREGEKGIRERGGA